MNALSDYVTVISKMTDSILSKIEQAVNEKGQYDKTFTANILQKISNTKALITYKGTIYTVRSTVSFEEGDLVRVCAPCNDWNDLFIVENRTSAGIHNRK